MYNSPHLTANTSKIKLYDKAELACLARCVSPETWQDQHDLTKGYVMQQSMRKLLAVLENRENDEKSSGKEQGKKNKKTRPIPINQASTKV